MKYKGSGDEGLLGSGVLLFEFLFFQFVLGGGFGESAHGSLSDPGSPVADVTRSGVLNGVSQVMGRKPA